MENLSGDHPASAPPSAPDALPPAPEPPPGAFDATAMEKLRALGDGRFLVEIVDQVIETGSQRMRSARAGREAGDRAAVCRAAHSLKSSAGIVGARRLQALADSLQNCDPGEDDRTFGARVDRMEEAFEEMLAHLRAQRERLTP